MKRFSLIFTVLFGLIAIISIIAFYLVSSNNKHKNSMLVPERIIVYTRGSRYEVKKTDPIFNIIVKHINEMVLDKRLAVEDCKVLHNELYTKAVRADLYGADKGIELFFNDFQKLYITNRSIKEINFKNLYIELNMLDGLSLLDPETGIYTGNLGKAEEHSMQEDELQVIPHIKFSEDDTYSRYEVINLGDPHNLLKDINTF